MIVAFDNNRAIGREGSLPWHLPADLRNFADITMGHPVLMGRTTFDSLPERYKPLPGRQNIVLSMSATALNASKNESDSVLQYAPNLEAAYEVAGDEPYVIGGARLYIEALPTIDRLFITKIDTEVEGADAHFPLIDENEWEITTETHKADDKNKYDYSFLTLIRKSQLLDSIGTNE